MSDNQDKVGQLTYEQFLMLSQAVKAIWDKERELGNVLEKLDTHGTHFFALFDKQIDELITLGDSLLGGGEWFSWFAFENDFGECGYECGFKSEKYPICDERDMFEFLKLAN